MKASGIVYLVLKGLPTPVSAASHWSPARDRDLDEKHRALGREEGTHSFLAQLIRARAWVRLGQDPTSGLEALGELRMRGYSGPRRRM